MARQIADNLIYKAPKPLDERTYFLTLEAMYAYPEIYMYDGLIAFCAEDSNFYMYDSRIQITGEITTKWTKQDAAERLNLHFMKWGTSGFTYYGLAHDTYYPNLMLHKELSSFEHDGIRYIYDHTEDGIDLNGDECTYDVYVGKGVIFGGIVDDDITKERTTIVQRAMKISNTTFTATNKEYNYVFMPELSGADSLIVTFEYTADIPTYDASGLDDGTLGYCQETMLYYSYDKDRADSETLGKWAPLLSNGSTPWDVKLGMKIKEGVYVYKSSEYAKNIGIDPERAIRLDGITYTYNGTFTAPDYETVPVESEWYSYLAEVVEAGTSATDLKVVKKVVAVTKNEYVYKPFTYKVHNMTVTTLN